MKITMLYRSLRLFLRLVGREWEPPGAIPEPYRVHHRMGVRESWQIAVSIWNITGHQPNTARKGR